ncbi:nucleotidyltransferase family protein [Allorhizobium borbori]|uniref:MurNAc alpha-1-phosphate uridylyltransferase n=1 Tax=Allorhizobium borbori TaxID=485907 RepID=A0A7W6P2Q8_9HYPH|nr:nucleotidyltransferase family protein [Allorhizobium borbori]MBB4104079.1 MurNAc alpha-1-phosphate uridylyltransferase [Allorhizobium borbori]
MTIRQAMVLAAGLGTRMRPITDTIPKPLVKIAGKAMVDYALDLLEEGGVTRAVVNVHYLADQMEAHLKARHHPEILISDERDQLLDSGGGAKKGFHLLEPGPVFIMNSDLFWVDAPNVHASSLTRLGQFFDPQTMDMALLCVPLERTTGHNGKKDFSLSPDGRLTRYRDGMENPVVYAGAIALTTGLLNNTPDGPFSLNRIFDRAIEGGRLYGLMLNGDWLTAGTPEAIGEAEAKLAALAAETAA